MDTSTRGGRLSPRARRAIPLIVAAGLVAAAAGLGYVQPSLLDALNPERRASAAGPALLPNDYQAAYSFLSPSLGWALVAERTSATPRFTVFRTTDRAGHWTRQFYRQLNVVSLAPLMVRFFDPRHGLIALGDPMETFRTSDGGANWALVKTPVYFSSSLVFADALHAWFLGWGKSSDQTVPSLFSTDDGGDTWIAHGPAPQWSLTAKGAHPNFAFRNPSEGWSGGLAAEPTVYSSADGGASWQPRILPSPCGVGKPFATGPQPLFTTEVSLLPGSGVVAFSNAGCGGGAAYTSFDGGTSWRPIASAPGSSTYSDFVYQDSSHWWVMRFGALWKSSDAGHSWKLVSRQTSGWDYVPHVIDANHAWAEVFGPPPGRSGVGLAVTSDGGRHWTQVSAPKP
jgi:photosystem II stability/assembly factor-like uncharacterized protein